MLNKNNFAVLAAANKKNWRLSGVLIRPDLTAATDGHRLIIVTTPTAHKVADLPGIEGADPVDEFEPIFVDYATAMRLKKAVPANKNMEQLNHVAVCRMEAGKPVKFYANDLIAPQIIQALPLEEKFPDFQCAIPQGEPELSLTLNLEYLGSIVGALKSMGLVHATFQLFGVKRPVLVQEVISETNQKVTALIMPVEPNLKKD